MIIINGAFIIFEYGFSLLMFAFACDDCAGLLAGSIEPIHCRTCFETEHKVC